MNEKFSRNHRKLGDNAENHSPDFPQESINGSFRTNSFFELYNNQTCMQNDIARKSRCNTENSLNRSDEENLNDDDDLNFDDLDDLGQEPDESSLNSKVLLSSDEEDEKNDKFDELDENAEIGEKDVNSNAINIMQRFRKHRSNSRVIHEDEIQSSLRQYAKSLPISIPVNWKSSISSCNRRPIKGDQDDNDLESYSFKDNPEINIAESIKALARSVRDDGYECFGDLPTRRVPTQPI